MGDEKRLIDEYEIIQSVKIDGQEIIVAENRDAKESYMLWHRSLGKSFGEESYMIPVYDSDYLKILREFIKYQSQCLDSLDLDRIYRGDSITDAALVAKDCVENGLSGDIKGKVVAVKADALPSEYRSRSRQLMLATGGSGCLPGACGLPVSGINIYSRRQESWTCSDILGVVDENTLPVWAREKLDSLRSPSEKKSVIEKIRQRRKTAETQKSKKRTHKKDGPEH